MSVDSGDLYTFNYSCPNAKILPHTVIIIIGKFSGVIILIRQKSEENVCLRSARKKTNSIIFPLFTCWRRCRRKFWCSVRSIITELPSPMIIILMARKRSKLAQNVLKGRFESRQGNFFVIFILNSHVSQCLRFNGRHNYSNFHPKSLCAIISAHSSSSKRNENFLARAEQWRQGIV